MNIVDEVNKHLAGDAIGRISAVLGKSETAIQTAADAAVPVLLDGLGKLVAGGQGARAADVVRRFDPAQLGGKVPPADESLLGTVLGGGNAIPAVSSALSAFTGMEPDALKRLLVKVLPAVLGTVAVVLKNKGITSGNLTDLFAQQKPNIAEAMPEGLSLAAVAGGRAGQKTTGLSPIILLCASGVALVAGGLLYYVFEWNKPPVVPPPEAPLVTVNPGMLSGELNTAFGVLTSTLPGVTDAKSAEAALPKLKEANGRLGAVTGSFGLMNDAGKAQIRRIVEARIEKVKDLVAKALAHPGVPEVLQPVLDEILGKFNSALE